jgi:hypothetical protein
MSKILNYRDQICVKQNRGTKIVHFVKHEDKNCAKQNKRLKLHIL